ncbi:hypothetical protein [Singulisphaera acidiphila]|uniref:hypothetical protein n=1 Tax=Singulisphaera acidiphila TaxID=466153 RepID=UPI00024713C8|nr:hypothetical protein [Singulisphaera acidiphila]
MYSSLFNLGTIDDHILNIRNQMCGEIDGVPASEIIGANVDSLAAEFSAKFQVACPLLLPKEIYCEEPAFTGGHEEVSVRVHLPFSGHHQLFKLSGGSAPIISQPIEIYPGELVFSFRLEKNKLDQLHPRVLAVAGRIKEGLASIQQKLEFYNPDLKKWAVQKIEERKAHLVLQ